MNVRGFAIVATGEPGGWQLGYSNRYTHFARDREEAEDMLDEVGDEHPEMRVVHATLTIHDGWDDEYQDSIDQDARRLSSLVWEAARSTLGREPYGGGCRTFYTPAQWARRGEEYGTNSRLVIVHDGGDFADLLNPAYESHALREAFHERLRELIPGLLIEPCTSWYAALYINLPDEVPCPENPT